MKQTILCLDMEGVLTPEIWEEVSKNTKIKELMLTTKDIADYDKLMKHRLEHMEKNGLTLSKIEEVISTIDPLPGAIDFLNRAREKMQVIILSDTFEEFAKPLIKKMNYPTIFCHNLIIEDDKITGYKLRIKDQKTKTVKKFK
ncbi:MAG: bifunctional phosphoserine phosphatase/homoserine phosphotransferase ThrH, partial [Candidatus Gracilibacteria bacterium]|nr:bifunctional phosphoserine phosphatase/homoserine phosphotransferase ThrH [Candidatus Gracilibacteria bacterium]